MGRKERRKRRQYKDDSKHLAKLVNEKGIEMDNFIEGFPDDPLPTEEQCVEAEDGHIAFLLERFVIEAPDKTHRESTGEEDDPMEIKKGQLAEILEMRKGYLFGRFAEGVEALEEKAAKMLSHCVKALEKVEKELKEEMPVKPANVSETFSDLLASLTKFVNGKYPDGIEGLDQYDDNLPEGIPSWSEFKDQVASKEEEMMAANEEEIGKGVEDIKTHNNEDIKEAVDDAIKAAIEDLKKDLGSDPYDFLDDDAAETLRGELIAAADEHCSARLG